MEEKVELGDDGVDFKVSQEELALKEAILAEIFQRASQPLTIRKEDEQGEKATLFQEGEKATLFQEGDKVDLFQKGELLDEVGEAISGWLKAAPAAPTTPPVGRVYFVTTRKYGDNSFSINSLDDTKEDEDKLSFGWVDVYSTGGSGNQLTMGKWEKKDKNTFDEAIKKDEKEMLLFFHGYNNSFEESLQAAATLLINTEWKGPLLAYCWPSSGNVLKYSDDERRMVASIKPFSLHVAELFGGKQDISMLGHSMGGRLAFEILRELQYKNHSKRVRVLIFAAADLTTTDFVTNRGMLHNAVAELVVVYHHTKDIPLLLSESILVHGKARLGLMDWTFSMNNVATLSYSSWLHSVDVTHLMNNRYYLYSMAALSFLIHPSAEPHSYFLQSPRVYTDIREVLRTGSTHSIGLLQAAGHPNVFYGN